MTKNTLIALSLSIILTACSSVSDFTSEPPPAMPLQPTTQSGIWQNNSTAIWNKLQSIPRSQLESMTESDPTRAAWIKLAVISKRYSNHADELAKTLMDWRNENPNHPGNSLFPSSATLANLSDNALPQHIALILPLEGPLAASGQAVRDGFLNAYYENLARTHMQQTISFYDSSKNPNIPALYQQAISEGAQAVVGPLTKEEVYSLSKIGNFPVPTLALNYTDSWGAATHFYQFGLSPFDETQQVANKARQAGLSRALLIAPQHARGQQLASSLTSHWQAQGGVIVDRFYYTPKNNFSENIARLLRASTDSDKKGHRRDDFDVIFLLAEPAPARTIVPLLRFNYANNVPIYSTSIIYSGSPDPAKDIDLNGVIFADIPWVVRGNQSSNRLFAVGRDAYLISSEIPRLSQLPNFPIYADTGALTLNSKQQIYRRLPWTKMHDGRP